MSRRYTGPDAATIALVKARGGGACLRCSRRPGEQIHHRIPRGMGGTHNPVVNSAPALVFICAQCHTEIESRRTQAYGDGWLVRRGADPAGVPLVTIDERMIMLGYEGMALVINSLAGINDEEPPF